MSVCQREHCDQEMAALREENARLRQRVEELEREKQQDRTYLIRRERTAISAEARLARVVELADHGIPFYAYSDNEAAGEMSHRLAQILDAAKGEALLDRERNQ